MHNTRNSFGIVFIYCYIVKFIKSTYSGMVKVWQARKSSEGQVGNIRQDDDNGNNEETEYQVFPIESKGKIQQRFQKRLTPDFGLGRGHTGEMENKIELLKMLG